MPVVAAVRDNRKNFSSAPQHEAPLRRPPKRHLTLTLLLAALIVALSGNSALAGQLVLVVDDVGYHLERGQRLIDLPGKITLGMLPFAPHTPELARLASKHNQEIILHQPMEPVASTHARRERGMLTLAMSPQHFDDQFDSALARVPQAIGVNNHTGSLLTAHHQPMNQLMGNIQRRGLLFLDSRTTPRTVAESTARAWRVPTLRRDVFLDHDPSKEAIAAAFAQALRIARHRGRAVVIAHPYENTVRFLESALPMLPEDVQLTTLMELAHQQRQVRGFDRTSLARLENPESRHILPAR